MELEALAGFGDDFLADFLIDKIVVRKGIATHGGEHVGGELSLRDGFCDRPPAPRSCASPPPCASSHILRTPSSHILHPVAWSTSVAVHTVACSTFDVTEPCRCTHQLQPLTACTKNRALGARGSDVTCIWTVVPRPYTIVDLKPLKPPWFTNLCAHTEHEQ